MKKILAAVIIVLFLASTVPASFSEATPAAQVSGVKHPDPANFKVRGDNIPGLDATPFYEAATVKGFTPMLHPHSPWEVQVSDDYLGGVYPLDFQLFTSGDHCDIWVGLSPTVYTGGYKDEWKANGAGLDDDELYFAYPWSYQGGAYWGAPRLQPGYRDYIKGSQLVELASEFDTKIWQTCKNYFGDYVDRPGPISDNKIQILIFNIRDGLFWDPVNAPYFIEGYFWDAISNAYNANVIHIDTYQWFRRQGASPTGAAPNVSPAYPTSLCLPYEYEGTFAHEYQHLIHNDINPNQLLWLNEGCSDLSEVVCGFGFPKSHISSYLDDWWETSLVTWQGSLANYGAAFLFTYYAQQHYGGQQFIYDLIHCGLPGIAAYNYALAHHGTTKTFDGVFQDWAIANYLDDTSLGTNKIYGYDVLDIPSDATQGYSIKISMASYQKEYPKAFNWNPQLEGNVQVGYPYPYGTMLPYTVNYVQFLQLGDHALATAFDGADTVGSAAHEGQYEWYSDGTPWSWFRLASPAFTATTGETLTFWSNYAIEQGWDYGYVEVHDINKDTWTTLAGSKTISTIPNPQDNPNCPNAYEPTAYLSAGKWNAFTGNSGGWYQEQMSLTQFAGDQIQVYFTYWTDGASEDIGWYIDDVHIGSTAYGFESDTMGWTTNAGWSRTTGIYPIQFKVNFIQGNTVTPLPLSSGNKGGPAVFPMINNAKVKSGIVTMVIAAQPGFELPLSTSYAFAYQKIPWIVTK